MPPMQLLSLRHFLDSWPYDPQHNLRLARGADGRALLIVRQPLGLQQYEVEGRPDGQRPHGLESLLHFHEARLTATQQAGAGAPPRQLTAEDCAELFEEAMLYYHRSIHFLRLGAWTHAERDADRNLHLAQVVRHYAARPEDQTRFAHVALAITRVSTSARVRRFKESWNEPSDSPSPPIGQPNGVQAHLERCPNPADTPPPSSAAIHPVVQPQQAGSDSAFLQEGDYWTILYRQQVVRLKSGRGLHYLALLLRHPRRQFHVVELLAVGLREVPAATGKAELAPSWPAAQHPNRSPILDVQAKADYKRRLKELEQDLAEAQQWKDESRALQAQEEIDSIHHHFLSALGLGGRDRQSPSEVERARSTVTHRIKEAIHRIRAVHLPLGQHLVATIRTGCLCSYTPDPDRPVAWKFSSFFDFFQL